MPPLTIVARIEHNRLPEQASQLRARMRQVVRKAALDIEAWAKQIVPVDTGNLKNSIQTSMEGDLAAVVSTAVEYAVYVEFGTRRMVARPFLGPAAEAVRPRFVAAAQRVMAP